MFDWDILFTKRRADINDDHISGKPKEETVGVRHDKSEVSPRQHNLPIALH